MSSTPNSEPQNRARRGGADDASNAPGSSPTLPRGSRVPAEIYERPPEPYTLKDEQKAFWKMLEYLDRRIETVVSRVDRLYIIAITATLGVIGTVGAAIVVFLMRSAGQ